MTLNSPNAQLIFLSASVIVVGAASSCRDYGVLSAHRDDIGGAPISSGAAATGTGVGGVPATGEGSAQGADEHSDGASGGEAGVVGNGQASGGDTGGAGDSHTAGGEPSSIETGVYGAVRLFLDGTPLCGGTLLNNSWVLTTDSCIPAGNPEMRIAYGADSANPDQVEKTVEVVRFPGNDGSVVHRGRDLALLAAEHPFRMHGATHGFNQPLWPQPNWVQAATQLCVGWDFSPDVPSDGRFMRQEELTPSSLQYNAKVGLLEAGDWLWWQRQWLPFRSAPSRPTNTDLGSSCIYPNNLVNFVLSVQTGVPAMRNNGSMNMGVESRSIGVAQDPIRAWVTATFLSSPELLPLPPLGPVAAAWSTESTLELIGVGQESGSLLWITRTNGAWGEPIDLGAPAAVELSSSLRPAGIWHGSAAAEVLAIDSSGELWHRRHANDGWNAWARVVSIDSPLTSGIRAVEQRATPNQFHVTARGSSGHLLYGRFDEGSWSWDDRGSQIVGEAAIDMPFDQHISIFFTDPKGMTNQVSYADGNWSPVSPVPGTGTISSAPSSASLSITQLELYGRTSSGTLAAFEYRGGWWSKGWLDTGLSMPMDTDPFAALRARGEGDLFVSNDDGGVWHVSWPRQP
jgi:hypothetical protein